MENNRDYTDSEDEEEVTFLLRLRPTPSPPSRRRRHSIECRPTPQTKENWDVVVQRKDVPSPVLNRRKIPSPVQKRNASPLNFQRIDYPERDCDTSPIFPRKNSSTQFQERGNNASTSFFQGRQASFPNLHRMDTFYPPESRGAVTSPVLQRRNIQSPNLQDQRINAFCQRRPSCISPVFEGIVTQEQYSPVSPPPLPPRILPSAPPLEESDKNIYPKQPPYYQYNRLNSEFSFSFPNLNAFSAASANVQEPFYGNQSSGVNFNGFSVGEFNGHIQETNLSNGMKPPMSPVMNRPPKPTPRSSLSQGESNGGLQNKKEVTNEQEIRIDKVSVNTYLTNI